MEVRLKYIGQIELDNEVIVSDPCYEADQDFNSAVNNVESGTYHCFIRECEVSLGDASTVHFRKSVLFALHEDYKDELPYNERKLIDVYDSLIYDCKETGSTAVDSGCAGIFDADYYRKNKKADKELQEKTGEYHPDNSWYERVTDCTLGKPYYGLAENKGILSMSGWGDGEYGFYTWKDGNDIIGFALDFSVENIDPEEPIIFVDETEGFLTLDEAIESQEVAASMPNGDAFAEQLASWLKELGDLRTILNERAPGEKEAAATEDMDDYDGPMTLDGAAGYFDSWPAQLPIEKQERFWLNQLLRARNRIEKDKIE